MRHWFKDQHMRSLLKNSSYLGASRIVAAIASVATLAFTGRALGVTLFGLLILIHSYAQAASSLSKFQSWQVIVRYGGQGLAAGRPEDFKVATGFALGLDILSGIVGMLLAIAILPLIGPWFGIPDRYISLAMLYCLVIPTMQAMTPGGVLRTLDRFELQVILAPFLIGLAVTWAALHIFALADRKERPALYAVICVLVVAAALGAFAGGVNWTLARLP